MNTQDLSLMWIDSHAHLTMPPLLEQTKEVLARAKKLHVEKILNVCCNKNALVEGLKISQVCPSFYLAASPSPHDAETEEESFFPLIEACAMEKKIIAIGETGLDYYYQHASQEKQIHCFIRYLLLAKKYSLPVILHCREAFTDLFALMDAHYPEAVAILHCFTGTEIEAAEALKRGWYISFSGIITFKKSMLLQEVLKKVPLENLLIETDSPYLAPEGKRGHINEPANIPLIAEKIAKEKNISLRDLSKQLEKNFKKIFPSTMA